MKFVKVARSLRRYQWFLIVLYISWNTSELANTGILLLAPDVDFECRETNSSGSQCFVDDVEDTTEEFMYSNETIGFQPNTTAATPCRNFTFDHSRFQWTLTERYNLVCDREWIISIMKSTYLVGYFLTALCFGTIADRFGRKGTIVVAGFGFIICDVGQIFVPNVWMYVGLRFVQSICSFTSYLTMYILMAESVRKEQRLLAKLLDVVSLDVLGTLLGGISFLVNSYVHLHIIFASCTGIVLTLICVFVHESPRWLYAQRREEEAIKILKKVAQFNSTDVGDLQYLMQDGEERDRGSFLTLFKTPLIRKRTMILTCIWFVIIIGFYAITYNINQFHEDVRVSLLILSAMEIFSAIPVLFLTKKFGRPAILFAVLFGAGLCCLAMSPLVEYRTHPALLALALTGRLLMSNAFFIVYLFTPELYPTVIRATGFGVCNTLSRMIAIITPQLALLNELWPPAMVVLLGILTISVSFLVPLLPDMTDVELPQTIDDGENLFPNHGYNLRKAKVTMNSNDGIPETTDL